MEWGEDEERFLRRRGTGVCAYGACFINLLNSCQVTPIFLSQRKCVASRSRRKSLKKISFPSYLFTSPLAHTILAFFICLIGADIQDSSMCAVFFICCQRGRQGRGLASRSNITPAVWCMVLANKLFAQYGNDPTIWCFNRLALFWDDARREGMAAGIFYVKQRGVS